MLHELSAAEGRGHADSTFAWTVGVAVFVAFLGTVLLGYSVVVIVRTYSAGLTAVAGAVILGMMGLMLLASATWMGVRAINNREG